MRFRLVALLATAVLLAACSAQEGTNANTDAPIPESGSPAAVASGADQTGGGAVGSAGVSPGASADDDDDAASGSPDAESCTDAVESASDDISAEDLTGDSDELDDAIEACGSLDELASAAEEHFDGIDAQTLETFVQSRCEESDDLSGTPVCEELAG